LKKIRIALFYIILPVWLVFILFNRKPSVSEEDQVYLNKFLSEWHLNIPEASIHATEASELSFISQLDHCIVCSIGHQRIQSSHFGNVRYYYEQRRGECYDRAVLLEKLLEYTHFQYRHIFAYYRNDNSACTFMDFLKKGTESHALTEIKTKDGWMVVGTNADWIGVDNKGRLLSLRDVQKLVEETHTVNLKQKPTMGTDFWELHPKFKYVYGVYSRKGEFLKPNIRIPQINFSMLLSGAFE
jgi:hypothetical protein